MPKLIIDGDSKGAVKATQELIDAQKQHGETVKRVENIYSDWNRKTIEWLKQQKKEAASAAAESKRLGEEAHKIILANEGPQERYNRKVGELSRLFVAGKLSINDMDTALKRYRGELSQIEPIQNSTFGEAGLLQLANYATSFIGLTAIIRGLSSAYQQAEQDAQKAADATFGGLGAMGQLQQVSTSPEDFQGLVGQARAMVTQGIFPADQQAQAADLVFAMRNAGYSKEEMATITELGLSRKVKPQDMQAVAEGLKKYQATFGKTEAGDINQVLQKVWSAAGTMQTDFPKAAQAATLFGSEASALKFSDEEALAAFVAIEQQSPGTEEAATRLRGLLTQITAKKLQNGSMTNTLQTLVQRVRGGEKAIDIVGEIRAAAGLNILASDTGFSTYEQQFKSIQSAQGQDLSGSANYVDTDPRLRAARLRAKYQGVLESADDVKFSEKENLYDALKAEQLKLIGTNRFLRYSTRLNQWINDTIGDEDSQFRKAVATGGYPEDLMAAMKDYLERTARGIESLDNKTRSAPAPSGRQER